MDIERAKYIIKYFSNLLTGAEIMAIQHTMFAIKSDSSPSSKLLSALKKTGWIIDDQEVLNLLKEGYEAFELRVANRILNEYKDVVFFNNCPKCGKLTRTPQAKQCRYCAYNWHKLIVAKFRLNNAFPLHGRGFILSGEVKSGEVKIGNYIDFTRIGLNCKAKIETIGIATKRIDGKPIGYIALGIKEFEEEQKERIKRFDGIELDFDILAEQ